MLLFTENAIVCKETNSDSSAFFMSVCGGSRRGGLNPRGQLCLLIWEHLLPTLAFLQASKLVGGICRCCHRFTKKSLIFLPHGFLGSLSHPPWSLAAC